MALHFFDVIGDGLQFDDTGTDCATRADVRAAVLDVLPGIARERTPNDGDRRSITVIARSESGMTVYGATLNISGFWLDERPAE